MRVLYYAGALIGVAMLVGCAGSPALRQAERTTSTARKALGELNGRVSTPSKRNRAEKWLRDAEALVDRWHRSGAGRLAWESLAPCLADALAELEAAWSRAGHEPPLELAQARMMAENASDRRCKRDDEGGQRRAQTP